MTRLPWALVAGACLSLFFLPWLLTVLLALASAAFVPLTPLIIGVLADTLYFAPGAHALPLYTLVGGGITLLALFVRTRLLTSIME